MRWIFIVWSLLWGANSFGADFADKLPIEVKQLADSFSCFTPRDKMVIYAYGLAIRYRMEHIKDKKALEHADLDYWRIHSLMYDLESRYTLDHLQDAVEEILTPTPALRKLLKRLRWVESALPQSDGAGESSVRMRKYDKKLLDLIMQHPPQWSFEPKNPYLHDYNLSELKTVPANALPKSVMQAIEQASRKNPKAKKALVRFHLLYEQIIRHYDQPKLRLKYVQEKAWVDACLERYGSSARGFMAGNFHRALAANLTLNRDYYPVRSDFLPKELDAYCEHNITSIQPTPYTLKKDEPVKAPPKVPKPTFAKTKSLLKQFKQAGVDTAKFDEYFRIALQMLEKDGQNLMGGLRLMRLRSCLENADAKRASRFLHTFLGEAKNGDYKEEFESRVLRPQMWWMVTIGMKMKQEGESDELKHFFDCNATSVTMHSSVSPKKKRVYHPPKPHKNYDPILSQKDEILKYYAATFVNKPTPDLMTRKAIQSGIVAPKWLDANGQIKPIEGVKVDITGMPQGGIRLTYKGVPPGKACERLTTLNVNDAIFYNHKTYSGLDYILIDQAKVKVGKHFNRQHAIRLCNRNKTHTISYVREKTIVERKYHPEPTDNTCDHYTKISTIDTLEYGPNGVATTQSKKYFALSGSGYRSRSGLYDASIPTKIFTLPEPMDNAFELCVREDGNRVAVMQGRSFSLWDASTGKIITSVPYDDPRFKKISLRRLKYLSKSRIAGIGDSRHSIVVLDPEKFQTILIIRPRFLSQEKVRKYGGPQITAYAFSSNGKTLYIGTNRKKIEVWKLEKSFLGFGELKATFVREIPLKHIPKVGAILPDPDQPNRLYIAGQNRRLIHLDIEHNTILEEYTADSYMGDIYGIQLSDSRNYLLVDGIDTSFIWEKDNPIQWDTFDGGGLKGATFRPDSDEIITIGKTVDVWKVRQ